MEISELLNKLELTGIDDVDKEGNTALHLTVADETLTQKEMIEVIEMLLDKGIHLNAKNYFNESALQLAVIYRLKDVVDYLISRKSNVDLVAHFFIHVEHSRFLKWLSQKDNSDAWIDRMQGIERETAIFVEWLISRGFDFDRKNQENQSALDMALTLNMQHILPVLLKYTKDIDVVDEYNRTLLHLFLENNFELSYNCIEKNWYSDRYTIDIMKTLLDRGISADSEDTNKLTPIRIAISEKKDISVIELLLERCTRIHRKSNDVETLLQMAMRKFSYSKESETEYHLKVLHSLLAKGADINELNESDKCGHTPLCSSVMYQNMSAIEFLRENGADFSVITEDGENLLHLLIRNNGFKKTDDNKKIILIDLLISKGCDVNAKDKMGNTPLHNVITYDNLAFTQKLIERGADVNCKGEDEMTPLHIAALITRNIDIVDLLRKCEADFNTTYENGLTVMHLFAMQRNYISYEKKLELLKSLIDGDCQVSVKDVNGSCPIHLAAMLADADSVRMLIECGAVVNCRDNEGETPLHFSLKNFDYSESTKIAELLLKHGANVDAKDSKGQSALHKVALESRSEHRVSGIFGTLVSYGADIDARDANGLTVLRCLQIDDGEKESSHELRYFAEYALKLKVANLPRSKLIDAWLAEVTQFTGIWEHHQRYYEEFVREIEMLKSTLIDEQTSLYAWLHMDSKKRCAYVNNQTLVDIVHPSNLESQFQKMRCKYSDLISAKYNEAVTRKPLLEPAKEAWMQLTENALPDLCVECIFSFLSNVDLFNIVEINQKTVL